MLIYYVYAYLRNDGTPYYIGKGKKSRAFDPYHGKIAVPKDKSLIVFLETNLSEIGAFALERFYIRWYGRKDLGTGILRNMTDGGEGAAGIVISEENKRKIGIANKNRKWSEKSRKKVSESLLGNKRLLGYFPSQETRKKISEANKGKTWKQSEEAKRKMKEAWVRRKNIKQHSSSLVP